MEFSKGNHKLKFQKLVRTRGGKIFSAARRGTENPPCVLVSLAVRVLQKNSEGCLLCLRPKSDASNASLSYCRTAISNNVLYMHT
jgi:hypothetical protein